MGTFVIDGKLKVNGDGTEVGVLTVNGGSLATNLTNSTSSWEQGHYFFVNDASAGGFGAAGTGATMNLFWVGTKDQPWCSIDSDGTLTAATLQGELDWSNLINIPTVTAGNGLTGGGALSGNITISHSNTSNATSLTANGRTYVTGLTFDDYGHVTGYTTGTETLVAPTFTNKDVTLAWGKKSTIATVGGVNITLTMPANPDTNTDTYGRTVNTTEKIYLMGGLSQNNSNKATYSNADCYAQGGYLYSGGNKVSVENHTHSNYALTDGSNASGTWPVSITGTAGAVAWGNVTGKPSTFTPAAHNHNDLYDTKGAAAAVKKELLNGADTAYDTLKELGDLIVNEQNAISALNTLISGRTVTAGNGLTGGGALANNITISHADTSSATNLTANGRKYVTGLTFDTYGHVTGYTTGTETVTDSNSAHSHNAGVGLALGSMTSGGTSGTVIYKAKLRNEAALTVDSAAATTTSGRVYPVVVDKSGYLAVNVPWTNVNSGYATTSGSNASGTWPISISGNAASASSVAWGNITDKPASYTPSAHDHSYAGSSSVGGAANSANWLNTNATLSYGASGLNYFNISGTATGAANENGTPTADWYHIIRMNHANANGYYFDIASCFHSDQMYYKRVASGSTAGWKHIWVEGNAVTSAVWNDYAEYRQSDCEEFGYVLTENGNDTLSKTTERLQHFAGISSDTWGFSQGETENAKTPIAVAGRVLAYTYRDRNEYKPGDCVCAAPGGTVDIMTREEVINWPDRIVGTVSCVPEYDTWGGGEGADRPPVQVNGRIWIKIK